MTDSGSLSSESLSPESRSSESLSKVMARYGGGSVQLTGGDNALYERHLTFDNVVASENSGPREQYEAFARSVRDVLSQRWIRTEQTYDRQNPKRVYYLSMEFLIGRSLANNITNMALDSYVPRLAAEKHLDWVGVLEQEPDAGLGNGGLGRLAACFLDSMATLQLPAMGYGLRYEYGIFRQSIENGWQTERPDNWLRRDDPWEVARPNEQVEIKLGCSFELRGGRLRLVPGVPSTLLGIPFDRPVVGYGGETINTLRLWAAAAPDYFDFQRFSQGEFVEALEEKLAAESLTRVLYPDDSTVSGQALRLLQEYFLVACSLADLVRRFRKANADWSTLPLSNFYLPFVQSAARYLTAGPVTERNLTPGSPLIAQFGPGADVRDARVRLPSGEFRPLPVTRGEVRYSRTGQPGAYTIFVNGTMPDWMKRVDFVIRTPSTESDLTPISPAQWQEITRTLGFEPIDPARESVVAAVSAARSGHELWLSLVGAVIVLGVVEMAIVRRWSGGAT